MLASIADFMMTHALAKGHSPDQDQIESGAARNQIQHNLRVLAPPQMLGRLGLETPLLPGPPGAPRNRAAMAQLSLDKALHCIDRQLLSGNMGDRDGGSLTLTGRAKASTRVWSFVAWGMGFRPPTKPHHHSSKGG